MALIEHFVRQTHSKHFSPADSKDTGGVMIFSTLKLKKPGIVEAFSVLVKGRITSSSWISSSHELHMINVHNYGLAPQDRQLVFSHIASLKARVHSSPTARLLFVCGDLNYHAPGEGPANPSKSGLATPPRSAKTPTSDALSWGKGLSNLTELAQHQFGFANPILTRIDRCYTSLPPRALLHQQLQASTSWVVTTNYAASLSDHISRSVSLRGTTFARQAPASKMVGCPPHLHSASSRDATLL
jgi:hypothetical protein